MSHDSLTELNIVVLQRSVYCVRCDGNFFLHIYSQFNSDHVSDKNFLKRPTFARSINRSHGVHLPVEKRVDIDAGRLQSGQQSTEMT